MDHKLATRWMLYHSEQLKNCKYCPSCYVKAVFNNECAYCGYQIHEPEIPKPELKPTSGGCVVTSLKIVLVMVILGVILSIALN